MRITAHQRRRHSDTSKPMEIQSAHSLVANIKINVNEMYEVTHWAKQLGVSKQQLLDAVAHVGPLVNAVRAHLDDTVGPRKT